MGKGPTGWKKKSLGVLVDGELIMSLQCALMAIKGQRDLGLQQEKHVQRVKGSDPSPQLNSGETHLEH